MDHDWRCAPGEDFPYLTHQLIKLSCSLKHLIRSFFCFEHSRPDLATWASSFWSAKVDHLIHAVPFYLSNNSSTCSESLRIEAAWNPYSFICRPQQFSAGISRYTSLIAGAASAHLHFAYSELILPYTPTQKRGKWPMTGLVEPSHCCPWQVWLFKN